jgi:aryl-alcohol dehydrogenase-like predicted oxidoreductase
MDTRHCGNSDLRLPVLGMGCWSFGGGEYWGLQDQSDVDAVVRRAIELGVTYFDTAEAYNEGRSERSLGQALSGLSRNEVLIGTKISPSHVQPDVLTRHCEASLRRLGTDTIDLYMVHWPITPHSIRHFTTEDLPCPSVEDAFSALLRLRDQGKIRHIGVSNFGPAKMEEALATGVDLAVNELPYNLLARAIEMEALPYCVEKGIGVIGYFALMQGLLADIWPSLEDVPVWQRRTRHFDSRNRPQVRHGGTGAELQTHQALESIRSICREVGASLPHIALRWVVHHPAITCTLVGSRNTRELEDNVAAVSGPVPEDLIDRLNEATRPLMEALGPSFDYYEDPMNDRTR